MLGERYYHIRMPATPGGTSKVGAIVFAHGYRGNPGAVMRNRSLTQIGDDLAVAIIAPKSSGLDWSLPNSPSRLRGEPQVDELAYFDRLLDDVTRRFPVDPERIVAAGFSAGGMMVWTLACHRSGRFAGFIPIAGTFWRPVPTTCSSPPASIFHLHGDRDPIVPLRGRPIGLAHQGDIGEALAMYSSHGSFGATNSIRRNAVRCERRGNPSGEILEFCLFSGGHDFRPEYLRMAWRAFLAEGQL
ncbi:MAG: alpha/beta hydrolase family esterase [Hyphomicrobiaceae bacterium]